MALDGTYAGLLASIAAWSWRTDLTDVIPDFVVLAEARINRLLRVRAMESPFTLNAVGGIATVALPPGYKRFKSIYVNGDYDNPLVYRSSEQLRTEYPGQATDEPQAYTVEGENLVLGPTPDADYTLNGICYLTLAPLSTTLNDIFLNNPDLYLWGALVEAWDFQKDDAAVKKYLTRFEGAIAEIETEDTADRISGSSLQVRTDITYA